MILHNFAKTGTGGQHCYVGDPVVSKFLCSSCSPLHEGRSATIQSVCSTAFHVFMCASGPVCGNKHAVGKRTVGVKVNVSNTEIYVFP